jgi:hypothetical protein
VLSLFLTDLLYDVKEDDSSDFLRHFLIATLENSIILQILRARHGTLTLDYAFCIPNQNKPQIQIYSAYKIIPRSVIHLVVNPARFAHPTRFAMDEGMPTQRAPFQTPVR